MHTAIVGAAPTGIFTAIALARRGHEVTAIDRDPGPDGDGSWNRRGVMLRTGHVDDVCCERGRAVGVLVDGHQVDAETGRRCIRPRRPVRPDLAGTSPGAPVTQHRTGPECGHRLFLGCGTEFGCKPLIPLYGWQRRG